MEYNRKDYINLIRPIPKYWRTDIYGIPFVKRNDIDITYLNNGKFLISVNNVSFKDNNKTNKIVHCFKDDKVLERIYNDPTKFIQKIASYYACSTLDFSMYPNMSVAQIIDATFKNRWSGMWLQINGFKNVIVAVGWVNEDTYDICFAGIENGTILMISTLSCCNKDNNSKQIFLNGYKELRKRFPDSKIICIGNKINGMDEDICYIPYIETFGNNEKYHYYYQPKMINWDNSDNVNLY